ncbi:hypothetical protein [Lysinibacillus sp. NPDC093692]
MNSVIDHTIKSFDNIVARFENHDYTIKERPKSIVGTVIHVIIVIGIL